MKNVVRAAFMAVWALTAASLSAAAKEEKWESRSITDKPGAVAINPEKAYILVRSSVQIGVILVRQPDANEATAQAQDRANALVKEHGKWVKRYANWKASMAQLKDMPKTVARPVKPLEPTESNFVYPSYEQTHSVTIGPVNRFSKNGDSVYLQEVKPGTYVFYGRGMLCACLGTVSFEAPAGKVIMLDAGGPSPAQNRNGADTPSEIAGSLPQYNPLMKIGTGGFSDPRLPEHALVSARFVPAGTRPNWMGLEADRVTAISGLFTYDRDKQILSPQSTQVTTGVTTVSGEN